MGDYGGGYGGGAFGGGGFVASPGEANKDAGDRGRTQRSEAVVPCTIKALTEAVNANPLDDQLKLFGSDMGNVTLVGKLVNVENAATQAVYTLDDGTGKIDIKMWADADAGPVEPNAVQKAELRKGVYVRAIGALRVYQGTKAMTAYSIRPVTDHDEVTFHFLEVCYVKQQMLKQHGGGAAGGGDAGRTAWNAAPPAHPYAAGGAAPGGGATVRISGEIKEDVRAVYEGPMGHRADGINVGSVVQALGGKYTEPAVIAAVADLVNEGLLYSTSDDRHFKSVNT